MGIVAAARDGHLRRGAAAEGYTRFCTAGEDLQHLTFGVARLQAGQEWALDTGGDEVLAVIIHGRVDAAVGDRRWEGLGGRANVWSAPATSVYAPPGQHLWVRAPDGPAEVALCQSPAGRGVEGQRRALGAPSVEGQRLALGAPSAPALAASPPLAPALAASPPLAPGLAASPPLGAPAPYVIGPGDVRRNPRGREPFAREVHDILDAERPAASLVVGETFNAAGNWSSYPPHKHDEARGEIEARLEELYYFQIDPPQGFGAQFLYTADGALDEVHRVGHGDVMLLPRGYHPVAAAPGYRLYYLWVMAGDGRVLRPFDDPEHAWVKQAN